MAKKSINKLNRKHTGESFSGALRSVQRILSQPSDTLVRELVTAASDPAGGAYAKDPDWSWAVSCAAFVIRRGAWVEEQVRLGRRVTPKDSRIAGIHSLLCVRCQEVLTGPTTATKPVNALLAKLAVSKNSATPAARIKAEKPVKSTPRQRGAKYLVLARESFAEDGNLAEPIELIDQASEALEAAS